ncbi:hypothetical protein CBM2595_A30410 [Cupriavidus taiwanensis]|nr:hypothetical protein CBM2595_A30410 [Cupriavidus taiwanensis]
MRGLPGVWFWTYPKNTNKNFHATAVLSFTGIARQRQRMDISRQALFGRLNLTLFKAIESATAFCKLRGNPYVELVHWLHQLLQAPDGDLQRMPAPCRRRPVRAGRRPDPRAGRVACRRHLDQRLLVPARVGDRAGLGLCDAGFFR